MFLCSYSYNSSSSQGLYIASSLFLVGIVPHIFSYDFNFRFSDCLWDLSLLNFFSLPLVCGSIILFEDHILSYNSFFFSSFFNTSVYLPLSMLCGSHNPEGLKKYKEIQIVKIQSKWNTPMCWGSYLAWTNAIGRRHFCEEKPRALISWPLRAPNPCGMADGSQGLSSVYALL